MANTSTPLSPLDPSSIITPHHYDSEIHKVVSQWFATEKMELNFGADEGRPAVDVQARRETLDGLFAQGWYVTAIREKAEDGEWERVIADVTDKHAEGNTNGDSDSDSSSRSNAKSNAHSTSSSESDSESDSTANNHSEAESTAGYSVWSGRDRTTSVADGEATAHNSGKNKVTSDGDSNNDSEEEAVGRETSSYRDNESSDAHEETTRTEGGAPYWYAYNCLRLERRRMQSEKVLQAMTDSLIDSYNKGREINVERYDELVALFTTMLTHTEDELNSMITEVPDLTPFFDEIKSKVNEALTNLADTSEIPQAWMTSRITDINEKFDALEGNAQAKMVDEGTYNSTVWASLLSNFEYQRSRALDALKDDMVMIRIEAHGKIATITAEVGNNLMNAQVRIFEALMKRQLEPTTMRNTVFKWMLDFMEHRRDEFPQLGDLPTIAERLGYSGGICAPDSAQS